MTKHARRNRHRQKRKSVSQTLRVPEALQQACMLFMPELLNELPLGTDLRKWVSDHIQPEDVAEVRDYLNSLLSSCRTTEELHAWWSASGARIRMAEPRGVLWLLTGIRDRLTGRPTRPNPGRRPNSHR